MAEYQLTDTPTILRTIDQANIPPDPLNADYVKYQAWVAAGGVPAPYVPPPPPAEPPPTPGEQVLFDHENRLRTIEGVPPLTIDQFTVRVRGSRKPAKP